MEGDLDGLTPQQREWINEPIPFIPGMDLRLANLLEKKGINRVIDLLECCPRENFCRDCERKDCSMVRLRGIADVGITYVNLIYVVLEGIGFCRANLARELNQAGKGGKQMKKKC